MYNFGCSIYIFNLLCLLGEWEISVLYDDEHIYGSPYTIKVYDPSQVKIYGLEGGTVGTGLTFTGKVLPFLFQVDSFR